MLFVINHSSSLGRGALDAALTAAMLDQQPQLALVGAGIDLLDDEAVAGKWAMLTELGLGELICVAHADSGRVSAPNGGSVPEDGTWSTRWLTPDAFGQYLQTQSTVVSF